MDEDSVSSFGMFEMLVRIGKVKVLKFKEKEIFCYFRVFIGFCYDICKYGKK